RSPGSSCLDRDCQLLEAPRLIDDELNRRLEAAQNAAPTKRRQEALQRDLTRVRKSMERLMTAYPSRSMNCAVGCRICVNENRPHMPSCNQLQPKRKIALPICGWQRRSRHFSAAYVPRPRHLISWNVNGSSDYWSRRYWSLTLRSLSGIRSQLRPTPLITTSRRNPPSLGHQNTQVIFCVQGVASPCLSNIFLHHVLDEWFENEVKPRLKGKSTLVRFADDAVMAFADHRDAQRVFDVLGKRLARYGLTLHPDKTRFIDFRSYRSDGKDHPEADGSSFTFLGFCHVWGKSRKRKNVVRQVTAKQRYARALAAVTAWCRENRHLPIPEQ